MQIRELSCKTLQIPIKTIKPQKTGKKSQNKNVKKFQKKLQPLLLWNGHPLTAKWDPPFIKYHYIINNNNIIYNHHHHHPRTSDANSATTEVPQPACRRSCHRSRWEPLPDDLQRPFRFKLFRPLGLAWTRLDLRLDIAWPLVVGCRGSHDLERSGRSEVTCCGTMKRLEGPTMRWPWQETIS